MTHAGEVARHLVWPDGADVRKDVNDAIDQYQRRRFA